MGMIAAQDIRDDNGMNHDEKGRFSSGGGGGVGHKGQRHSNRSDRNDNAFDDVKSSLDDILSNLKTSPYTPAHMGNPYHFNHASPYGAYSKHPPVFRIPNVKTKGPKKQQWRYVDTHGVKHDTRVDAITNQPISPAFEDTINRLYRGEEIPLKDIESLPEIAREKKLADAYCTLDEFMHPEDYKNKQEKMDAIYSQFSSPTITAATNEALHEGESYQVKQGKEIWLVTGLPGSGKSTSFVGPLSKANNARVVDSDAIKEKLPGFCRGLGAPNVHTMSKSINDQILVESLNRGDNIVYPVLGYNTDYVGDQIDSFRRKGYKVHLTLNELPFSQSLARCLERRLATGRNIPLAMFAKVGDRPSEAYEALKKKVDTYEKFTGDGLTTKRVDKGENKDLPPPRRREHIYSYHGVPLTDVATYEHDKYGNTHFSHPIKGHTSPSERFATEFHVKPQAKPKYWGKSWLDSVAKGKDAAQDEDDNGLDSNQPYTHISIPDTFDGEIDGVESARDLARYHYIAYDRD